MLIRFVDLYNHQVVTNTQYEKVRQTLLLHIGKKLTWYSKHEPNQNKELVVVIERLSNRFATVFRVLEDGQKIRHTINYHNLICGDDEIRIRPTKVD